MTRARVLFVSLFLAVTLLAQSHTAPIPTIGTSGWFGWKVPIRGHTICCNRCSLDSNQGFSINDDDDLDISTEMLIAVRVEDGKIRKVRLFDGSCNVPKVTMLPNVSTENSLDYLLSQIRNADREGELMAAISMHDHPRVVPALLELARHDPETETRRHAIFWLGQRAGEKVAGELRRFVDEDPDEDIKTHAVFAIAQLPRERSVPLLIDLVKTHKNRAVRERAMFWLAQTGDPRAIDLIESILLK
ncbi:MAG: HEAT repeat domain-containing protein [Thermoanaerobaculia bacterium]